MTSIRRRVAVLAVSAAVAVPGAVFAAVPASAGIVPCSTYEKEYQADKAKAASYYQQYQHSSGATRTKAHQEYVAWTQKAQVAKDDYAECVNR